MQTKIINLLLKLYYQVLCGLSYKVVVFEGFLRERLIKIGAPKNKVITISHGVHEVKNAPSKNSARKKLGLPRDDFVVLCFGFLIWYKGSDFIVDAFRNKSKKEDMKLIMAGGESNVHKNDPAYRSYMSKLYEMAKFGGNRVKITGFLKEEEISLYFAACDLVILPYRVLISASGPLSFAITHKKPFIISKALVGYSNSKDFNNGLDYAKLNIEDISFELDGESVINKIRDFKNSPSLLERGEKFSHYLYSKRNWTEVGRLYKEVVVTPPAQSLW